MREEAISSAVLLDAADGDRGHWEASCGHHDRVDGPLVRRLVSGDCCLVSDQAAGCIVELSELFVNQILQVLVERSWVTIDPCGVTQSTANDLERGESLPQVDDHVGRL